jgi:hypothetical protein
MTRQSILTFVTNVDKIHDILIRLRIDCTIYYAVGWLFHTICLLYNTETLYLIAPYCEY